MPVTKPRKMATLEFMLEHYKKQYEPERWAALFGIEIIDDDGWRGKNAPSFTEPCSLTEFLDRITHCTIFPLG
jgi:hypothetical protein